MIANEPNVIWCPGDETEPPAYYQDGRDTVLIPEPHIAKRGFYSADAARIIRLSGGRFKRFVQKGQPVVKTGKPQSRKKSK